MLPRRFERTIATTRRAFTLRRGVLAVILVLNLRTFEFFPGGRPIEEGWFILCLAAFAVLMPLFKIHSSWKFSRLEIYLLALMIGLTLVPAISAQRVFGQPLVYGLLARRSTILLGTWVLLINAWRRDWLDLDDLQHVLLSLMWMVCALYAGMRLFLNPASFPTAPIGFILGFGSEQAFSVPGYLLPFGVIYYGLRAIREGSVRCGILGLVILIVAAGGSWRALVSSLSVTLLFFLFRWKPFPEAAMTLLRFLLLAAVVLGAIGAVRPEAIKSAEVHMQEALRVAFGGGPGGDPSANARIEEANTAMPFVKAHPVLGVGLLSVQWRGGVLGVLGAYFSDSDIGILGILFTYGALGLVLASIQYVFALTAALRMPSGVHTPFLDGILGFTLFTAIFSVSTGMFVVEIESTMLFVVLLEEVSRQAERRRALAPVPAAPPIVLRLGGITDPA